MLNSEGLTAFVNASYSPSKPGLPVDPLLDYKTRSFISEAGFSYPFIRQRERNLTFTGLGFFSDDQSDIFGLPLFRDRLRGIRLKTEADYADDVQRHQPDLCRSQPRLRGARQHRKRQSAGFARIWPRSISPSSR